MPRYRPRRPVWLLIGNALGFLNLGYGLGSVARSGLELPGPLNLVIAAVLFGWVYWLRPSSDIT